MPNRYSVVRTDVLRQPKTAGNRRSAASALGDIRWSGAYRRDARFHEACRALIESEWARGAEVAVAHTLEGLEPSIGVLRRLGFSPTDPLQPGAIAFTLRRRERPLDIA